MQTAIICTVGGSHEPIVGAIEKLKPQYVCFVCSGDDSATGNKGSYLQITGKGSVIKACTSDDKPILPNIPTLTGLQANQYEILKVSPDDFDDIYEKVMVWLAGRERQSEHIVADYTGGTKTMSAALVAAALEDEGVELQLMTGSRSNLVKVESGSEIAVPASLEKTRFRRRLQEAVSAWSRFAYEESEATLKAMSVPADHQLRGDYQRDFDLSRAFALWDRFNHADAKRIIDPYRKILWKDQGNLLGALDLLNKDSPAQEPSRLLDLWLNAQRRAKQGRYDDAMARAYRLLEWSAQWLLRGKVGIETSDVPKEKIPVGINLTQNHEGKYQAALFNTWELASYYAGEDVESFWSEEKETLKDLVYARNNSILAHGFMPVSEDKWVSMETWIGRALLPLLQKFYREPPYRIRCLPDQLPLKVPDRLPQKVDA